MNSQPVWEKLISSTSLLHHAKSKSVPMWLTLDTKHICSMNHIAMCRTIWFSNDSAFHEKITALSVCQPFFKTSIRSCTKLIPVPAWTISTSFYNSFPVAISRWAVLTSTYCLIIYQWVPLTYLATQRNGDNVNFYSAYSAVSSISDLDGMSFQLCFKKWPFLEINFYSAYSTFYISFQLFSFSISTFNTVND